MDVVGYAEIKKDAKTGNGQRLETFHGEVCRVMEFASDGGVFVVNRQATGLAMFDKEDVVRKFECRELGGYIFPPDMDAMAQICYMGRVQTRKGGWAPILKEMIIMASLHKGIFTDSVLWQKQ